MMDPIQRSLLVTEDGAIEACIEICANIVGKRGDAVDCLEALLGFRAARRLKMPIPAEATP